MNKATIIVATHKAYKMPTYKTYLPLQVGKEGKTSLGYQGDNEGDNISSKNPSFCELTGLYWAYKNLDSDYIGLVHYRRYFNGKTKTNDKFKQVLSDSEIKELIKHNGVILRKPRNYYIEPLYSHYEHTMYVGTLIKTREIVEKQCPEYLVEFDKLKTRRKAHMFNMFIMKKDILNNYCHW